MSAAGSRGGPLVIASQLTEAMNARILAAVPGVEIEAVAQGFPTELPERATVFFAAPFRAGVPVYPSKPQWPSRVQWIHLLTAGADGYPDWYFDVARVTCSRGPTARPVAEFAMAQVLAHAKRLPQAWIRDAADWKPMETAMVHGSTLGILGFGAIGQAIAELARAFGMRVLVTRRSSAPVGMDGVATVPLDVLMRESDHVVIAAAATAQSHRLVGREALAHAKPGMHIVNIARGALLDTDALIEALDEGRVARASLDVTEPEPLPAGHALYTHPKVRLSPHLSALDPGLRDRVADVFVENLRRYLAGSGLLNAVDRARGY